MRTTEGLKRVDVIYRRVDDDFLDPLTFRPDSALGVPGLMSPMPPATSRLRMRSATGIAETRRFIPTCRRFVKFLSRRRADPEERADLALPRAKGPVLRARQPERPGGQGSSWLRRLRMLIGPAATKPRSRRSATSSSASPRVLSPSRRWRCPPAPPAPRPASRRAMSTAAVRADRQQADHHRARRLTRVALKEGSLVVNSSQGGGTKDTWILDE